ncbi:MAG: endolytic transglycosylase MltG [Desulfohalobiaceae bacterium]
MRKYILPLGVLVFLCLALYGAYTVSSYLYAPIQEPGREKIIRIRSGWTFDRVAEYLIQEDIIRSPLRFKLMAKLTDMASTVKAGEYEVDTSWSRMELLSHLNEGDVRLHKLQIPEGLAWWEIARRVEDSGLASFSGFAAQVRNQELLDQYGIPGQTAEGFLYPETYYFSRSKNQSARRIVSKMLQQFREETSRELWPEQRPEDERLSRIVTLASLVEKETSVPEERPIVAGVFQNRLRRGMRLQCDPTVIYGLGRDFDGNLRKKNLRDADNPYNTYRHTGLPPSPICSPGLGSLKAAEEPAEHDYLYFVATKNGTHVFSRNLRQHNKAVRKHQLR